MGRGYACGGVCSCRRGALGDGHTGDLDPERSDQVVRNRPGRALWFVGGWVAVGVGGLGVVVPGLPTTGFLIIAASCFPRSSPRFEQWVLDLPRFGPMV